MATKESGLPTDSSENTRAGPPRMESYLNECGDWGVARASGSRIAQVSDHESPPEVLQSGPTVAPSKRPSKRQDTLPSADRRLVSIKYFGVLLFSEGGLARKLRWYWWLALQGDTGASSVNALRTFCRPARRASQPATNKGPNEDDRESASGRLAPVFFVFGSFSWNRCQFLTR